MMIRHIGSTDGERLARIEQKLDENISEFKRERGLCNGRTAELDKRVRETENTINKGTGALTILSASMGILGAVIVKVFWK